MCSCRCLVVDTPSARSSGSSFTVLCRMAHVYRALSRYGCGFDEDECGTFAAMLSNMDEVQHLTMEQIVSASAEVTSAGYAQDQTRVPDADAVIREPFGIRFNRTDAWKDLDDFDSKNLEPVETIYRLIRGMISPTEWLYNGTNGMPTRLQRRTKFVRSCLLKVLTYRVLRL